MTEHVTCPECGYHQVQASQCCECRAALPWSRAALLRLHDAISALPA